MKNIFRALMLMSVFCLALPGQASAAGIGQFEFHPYMGLGLGAYNMKFKMNSIGFSQTNTVFGGYLQLGADFNDYLGAELRIGTTAKGTSDYVNGSVTQQATSLFSYLVKLQYPTTPELRLYALVGGTTANGKLDVTVTTPPVVAIGSTTKTGVSFGAGLDYKVADQLRAGIEWVRYENDLTVDSATASKATVDGYTATLKYMF